MANSNAVTSNQGISLFKPSIITLKITVGSTYTASSGGVTFSLTQVLTECANANSVPPIAIGNVVHGWGSSALGWMVCAFAIGSSNNITFKLFNGTSQFTNGACTEVVTLHLLVTQ